MAKKLSLLDKILQVITLVIPMVPPIIAIVSKPKGTTKPKV